MRMSFGIHRIWKNELMHLLNPSENTKLIDVACGTGDIGNLFLKATNRRYLRETYSYAI